MAKYTSTPFGVKTQTARSKPDKTQVALTYDILSEGEIEGLSDGLASVFLNDVPIIDKLANDIVKVRRTTLNTTANNTTITSSIFGDIAALSHNNLTGISLGTRTILIEKGKATTAVASGSAGSTTVTTSSNFFTAVMLSSLKNSRARGFIRIEGAGPNGSTLVTGASFVSQTEINLSTPLATTVSNTNLHVDLITTISSISGNNATLNTAPGVSLTATSVVVTGADISSTKLKSLFNIDNFQFGLRGGTMTQSPLIIDSDFGQSSIISSPNIDMIQNNLRANIGTTGNLHAGYNNELDEPSQSEGTAADTLLTSAFLGVSNPSEVDEVHLTFNFPSCHAIKSNGTKEATFIELQMFFEYSTDGGSSYTSELAFGPSNNNVLNRAGGRGGTNVNFITNGNGVQPNNGYVKPTSPQYTAFSEEFVMNTEQFQPYDNWRIRVRRINDLNFKDGSFRHTNPCVLSTVESIVKDKLRYPHTAYAAVAFNAKDFNSQLPERAYTLKGLKIQVPTNYRTREETGGAATYKRNISSGVAESTYQNWDGNFRGDTTTFNVNSVNHTKVFCDNPVWVFYDLLVNERYGIGQFIDKSQIDIYELFRIAKYCDEEVPDGNGGTEPRFTCNVYLPKAAEATNVLKQFASIFRGIALWNEGNLTLAVDRPKQPVYSFSKANVLGGAFTYEGTGDRVRTNQVKVTWNDPQDNFRQSTEYVEDYESIADTGRIVRAEQLAFGCTSRGQAHRLGKWKLLSEQNENETVSFSTSLNASGLKPGDIILVQDADKDRSSYSGRVSNTGTKTAGIIPLDRTISLPAYSTAFKHELHLIYPSGGAYLQEESAVVGGTTFYEGDLLASITTSTAAANAKDDSNNSINVIWSENVRVEKQKVITNSGNRSSLAVASNFTSVPDAEVMWVLKLYNTDGTEKTGTAKEFRILSIKEEEKMQFDIVASAYHRNKFSEIERGFNLGATPVKTAPDPEDVIPAPANLVVNVSPEDSSNSAADGNITGYKATITWDYPVNEDGSKFKFCNGFEVEHNFSEETKSVLVGNNEQAITVSGISAGEYIIRIRTRSTIGTVSTFLQREVTITERELSPPTKSRLEDIQKGGEVDQTVTLAATGTISFGSTTYTITSPDGAIYSNTSSNAATNTQAFAGMGASAEAFLLFDASETTDRLKAIQVHTDNGSNPPVNYIKEVGASNNGLTGGSGTIQINEFSNQVNGTGTSFESDYVAGDLFRIDGGAATTRTTSGAVTNSTTITLSSANSDIKVGMLVSGTGVGTATVDSETVSTGNPHVVAISGTTLVLSSKQTIASGVTLTFTPLITYARVRFVESDTLIFLDEISQKPYNAAGYFKQTFIPDINNDFILARITTNGSTAYTLAEQFVTSAPADSPQFVKGFVYFGDWNGLTSLPGTPSASAYNFGTKSFTGLTANWSQVKPPAPYAVSGFTFREGDGSVTFDIVRGVSKWLDLPPERFSINIDDTNRRIRLRPDTNDTSFDVLESATQLFNDRITTNADGTINYDGTTAVAPNINNMPDAGNTKTGAARGFAGLASNGDVDRAVPTGKGGTGETNTNKFLNSGIGISQGSNGVFTLDKGDGGSDTTTITKSLLNLDYFDGANKAEFDSVTGTDGVFGFKLNNAGSFTNVDVLDSTSRTRFGRLRAGTDPLDASKSIRNTGITLSADGNLSGGGTSSQINIDSVTGVANFKSRVETGLNSSGDVDRPVPTGKGGTGETNTNKFLNSGIAISQGNSGLFTLTKGDGTTDTTTITKSKLGLSYTDGATVGAVAGTNLKDSGGSTLSDVDVRNSDLDIDTSGTDIRIKKGTSIIQSTTLDKGSVGLTNLNSLESGTGTKLSGIATGATVGAQAGTNLKKADGTTTLGDADIVTSQGTSSDTSNVNSITSSNVTGGVTQVNTNLGNLQDSLEDGTASVNASAIDIGELNTDRLNLQELFLPTTGTASTGVTHSITSSGQNTTRFLFDAGTGPGYYVGHISFDNSIRVMRGGPISSGGPVLFLQAGGSTLFQGSMFATHSYDRGRGQFTADGPYHMPFAFFYTGTGTVKVNVKLETTSGTESLSIKGRAVKFGAELASFDTSSFTASRTVSAGSGNSDSGTVTVSTAGGGSSSVSLSGNTSALVSINGGTFVNAASVGTISNNQTFEIRIPASSSSGVTRSATVTIDGISATYSVATSGTYNSGGYGSGGGGTGGLADITDLR